MVKFLKEEKFKDFCGGSVGWGVAGSGFDVEF